MQCNGKGRSSRSRHRSQTFLRIFPTTAATKGKRNKNPLFGQLAKASQRCGCSAKLNRWTDKLRDSELDMRTGAWRRFDIDEAIKISDRKKAEVAAKNPVPDS
jgi:hypothetical protein